MPKGRWQNRKVLTEGFTTRASPCQGRWQKSLIFDGGVVNHIRLFLFSPSVTYGDSSLVRGSHGLLSSQKRSEFHTGRAKDYPLRLAEAVLRIPPEWLKPFFPPLGQGGQMCASIISSFRARWAKRLPLEEVFRQEQAPALRGVEGAAPYG